MTHAERTRRRAELTRASRRFLEPFDQHPAGPPPLAPMPAWQADGRALTGLTPVDGPPSPGTGAPIGTATVLGWLRRDGRAIVRILESAPPQGPLIRPHREPGMPIAARQWPTGPGAYGECPSCGAWLTEPTLTAHRQLQAHKRWTRSLARTTVSEPTPPPAPADVLVHIPWQRPWQQAPRQWRDTGPLDPTIRPIV